MSKKREGLFYALEKDTNFNTRFEEHQDFVEAMEQKEFLKINTIEGNKFSTPFQDIWTNPEQTHQVYFVHDPITNINYLRIKGDIESRPKSIRRLGRRLSYFLETELATDLEEALEEKDENKTVIAISNFFANFCFYDPRYLNVFKLYLEQSSVKVRLATIRAIGFQLWNECAPLLENLIFSDPNPAVREYASQTLKQIQQPDFDPDNLYENPSNYPHSFERITEKGLMILPQIKDDLQAWMKEQKYSVVDALVLYQYLVEVYGEFKTTDESIDENKTAEIELENEDNSEPTTETIEPQQPEINHSQQLQQELAQDKLQLKSLRSQLTKTEERIKQARRINIFGRPESGDNEREKDRLTQEIEAVREKITQNEALISSLEEQNDSN